MDYKEFRQAAHRHLITCQKMCDSLSGLTNSEDKNLIIANIYYLSGYVVETLLSYAFFCSCNSKTRKKPIEEHPEYEKGFKTHDFQAKISFVKKHNCNLDGITFISNKHSNDVFMKLYNGWQVDLRYRSPKNIVRVSVIDETLIKGYIDSLKEVEIQFINKFV